MYKTLTIKNGSTNIVTATTNPKADINANILTESDMEEVNATIETEPKLIGNGSYIVSERIDERDLNFTINVISNVRSVMNSLKSQQFNFSELTFQMQYFNNNSSSPFETVTLKGKITKLAAPRGYNDWGDIEISALCVEPT